MFGLCQGRGCIKGEVAGRGWMKGKWEGEGRKGRSAGVKLQRGTLGISCVFECTMNSNTSRGISSHMSFFFNVFVPHSLKI